MQRQPSSHDASGVNRQGRVILGEPPTFTPRVAAGGPVPVACHTQNHPVMTRLRLTLLLLAAFSAGLRAQERPNVLLILVDDLNDWVVAMGGHPQARTPNIDRLAARGVRFTKAYTNATLCGPARMSAYTGRYVRSHGAHGNNTPLRIGEPTLGDHLKEIGVRNVLVGKTHMEPDVEGMKRLGIDPDSVIGVHVSQCGFEPYVRHDGLHPDGPYDPNPEYDDYLRAQGFDASNPWEHWANSAMGDDGRLLNGWLNVHADKPARIPEEHSETPWTTRRAMDFMREAEADGRPWCLHLSYIKPHWPYIVPAPYHAMYGRDHLLPPVRSASELVDPHPILAAFQRSRVSRTFSRDEVRERVLPAYMGLVKQIDDQLGLLWRFLEETGLAETTLVVLTSDHGDYLGDHWMGEKNLFHDCIGAGALDRPRSVAGGRCDARHGGDALRGGDRRGADGPGWARAGSRAAPGGRPLAARADAR